MDSHLSEEMVKQVFFQSDEKRKDPLVGGGKDTAGNWQSHGNPSGEERLN